MSGPTDAAGGREPAAQRFLEDFRRRHGSGAVRDALATLRPLKVLVVGEAIIDEYDYCVPLGKAPKEPIISARHVKLERQAGGVLACANLAGFCDEVDLVTSLGADDSQEAFIRDRLRPNIWPCFFLRDGASTITKRRYVWEPGLLKMFEVAVMDDGPLPPPSRTGCSCISKRRCPSTTSSSSPTTGTASSAHEPSICSPPARAIWP